METQSRLLLAACLATGMACLSVHADPVYKWVDGEGHTHYSSTPPASTGVNAQQVNVAAPQVVTMVTPAMPKVPRQNTPPHPANGMSKAQADAVDQQIRGTWGNFTDALVCESLEKQIDDLKNGVSPDPVTHTTLTAAERSAREQTLDAQKKRNCP